MMGFQLQGFNDLNVPTASGGCVQSRSGANYFALGAFVSNVPLHFYGKSHGRCREQIRRKRIGQILCR